MRKNKSGSITNAEKQEKNPQIKTETIGEELSISREQVMCNPTQFEGVKKYCLDPDIKWVKTSSITASNFHSSIYSDEVLDEAFIESVRSQGILNPLVVNKDNVIISGVLRHKIAMLLELEELPVIYSNSTDVLGEEVVGYNIQRKKSYYVIFKEYMLLKEVLGISQGARTDIKKSKNQMKFTTVLGVSMPTIYRLIKISNLCKALYGEDETKTKEIWKKVDSPKGGITKTINYLESQIQLRSNKDGIVKNIRGNGYEIYGTSSAELNELKDETVDLHVCSPPYWGGIRNYDLGKTELGWESTATEFAENLANHFDATKRVLKHTGSLVVNIGDTNKTENSEKALTPFLFATKMKEKGWHVAGVYIWIKNNFRPTLSENKAITTFEYIFHFAKSSEYSYYKDWMSETTDPIYNKLIFGKNNKRSLKDVLDLRTEFFDGIINTNCSNTINLTNECKKKGVVMNHTATFPILIPSIFVNLTTKPGDLVIDGFNGTGTTGAACQILGRNYVGFELNKNYIDISQVRMEYVEDVLREAA